MQQHIFIAAEPREGPRATHAKWLYLLLRELLRSAVADVRIGYGSFVDADREHADLVIGFELSKEAKTLLEKASSPYIDLRIHPLRFLDDIFFSFETNVPAVRALLKNYGISEALCRMHADHVKATVIKLKKAELIRPNSLLLLGQTEADNVVFDGERYLVLTDRIEQISELSKGYGHIYFKPHPYAKNGRRVYRELKKALGEVSYIDANIYHLLGNDGVAHVAALNSSALYEAAYFGKKTTFLFTPTFGERHVGVYDAFFSGAFWSDVLSPLLATAPSALACPPQPGRLRKMLNDFWGYSAVNDEIVLADMMKSKIKRFWNKVR